MAAETRPENLTFILDRIAKRIEDDGPEANSRDITLGDILDIVGRQAYGPLLLIIGVMSVSPLALLPGSTWAFALLTLLVAAQMAFNLKHPWLPRSALRLSFPEDKVAGAIDKVRPWTAAVDKVVKPRMEFLAQEPWLLLIAVLAIAAAIVTFPLSFIPFAPLIPGLAVILVGLGVTARDGLVLGIAIMLVGLAAVWLALRFF